MLLIPLSAQGHLLPATEIAQRLVEQDVKVTFPNTEGTHKEVTSDSLKKYDNENPCFH